MENFHPLRKALPSHRFRPRHSHKMRRIASLTLGDPQGLARPPVAASSPLRRLRLLPSSR